MRRSKQTPSWHHDSIPNTTPQRSRISRNLFSIISRFEELDAVSLPIKRKSLLPAPLQLSHTSPRRQTVTKAAQIRKLSRIFSPRDKSNGTQEVVGSIDEAALGRGDFKGVHGILDANSSARRHRKSKVRRARSSSRASSMKPHDISQDKGVVDTVEQEKREGGSKRRRTIKDFIRLYDGSMNPYFSLSLSLSC